MRSSTRRTALVAVRVIVAAALTAVLLVPLLCAATGTTPVVVSDDAANLAYEPGDILYLSEPASGQTIGDVRVHVAQPWTALLRWSGTAWGRILGSLLLVAVLWPCGQHSRRPRVPSEPGSSQ